MRGYKGCMSLCMMCNRFLVLLKQSSDLHCRLAGQVPSLVSIFAKERGMRVFLLVRTNPTLYSRRCLNSSIMFASSIASNSLSRVSWSTWVTVPSLPTFVCKAEAVFQIVWTDLAPSQIIGYLLSLSGSLKLWHSELKLIECFLCGSSSLCLHELYCTECARESHYTEDLHSRS